MAQLTGIAVTLITSDIEDAGTDDNLFIGVVGTAGGREFPLDTSKNDFESGKEEFVFGEIWEGGVITSETKFPTNSKPGENNDPAFFPIELEQVNFVYLRKQGLPDEAPDNDDAHVVVELGVKLYGPSSPSKRVFFLRLNRPLSMANEFGHIVYLRENLG
jgi:PLAT/LH2 domain